MVAKINIGVILGGRSGEHEVSLMSARSVLSVLDPRKYAVTQIGISHAGQWLAGENVLEALEADDARRLQPAAILADPNLPGLYGLRHLVGEGEAWPRQGEAWSGQGEAWSGQGEAWSGQQVIELLATLDVIFPVLHGTFGEDGTLQGLLELADVAYVGAGVLASAVGMDKGLFKDVMRANGIPVVNSLILLRSEVEADMETVLAKSESLAPYPLFVKPANLGSSVGISKCRSRSDLVEGLLDAARFDRRILVERGINAREIEVSVLGNADPQVSIPGEIRPADEFYTYSAKYLDERSELIIPAPLDTATNARVRDYALRAYKAVDCAGMARADFLLDRDSGDLFLGEINTIPGFTRISMYPKLWEASGLPYSDLVDRLVALALERKADRDHTERRYAAHPANKSNNRRGK